MAAKIFILSWRSGQFNEERSDLYASDPQKSHGNFMAWLCRAIDDIPITSAGIIEKSSVIGRTGLMLLSCGTGAWRVRQSMNTLAEQLGLTCTADIGLMSIEYTCFDGEECYSQSLCLTNTGVNTSKLNRLEQFINKFSSEGVYMTGEELHSHLDQIEKYMVSTLRPHLVLQPHLPVAHLPFYLEADR